MRNNSETDKNKSAQYKVKSRHYKWLLLITENILKHPKKEPIKSLGINLSYKHENNDNLNFFIKIYKMDTKLNIWQTRDLTLFGRTMLVKTLGLSKLV